MNQIPSSYNRYTTFETRLGMTFVVEAAMCSVIATFAVLVYIIVSDTAKLNFVKLIHTQYSATRIRRSAVLRWSSDTEIHALFISLMFANLIQSLGTGGKWLHCLLWLTMMSVI